MANRWLKLLEAHIEKGIVGLAALYMFAMLFLYLVRSPNAVEYRGSARGPGDLLEAVKEDADRLAQTFQRGMEEQPEIESFSDKLKRRHNDGIFAAAPGEQALLKPELRLAAVYGQPTVVPGKESEEPSGSVEVKPPLSPSLPKVRTGRSLALRQQIRLTGLEEPAEAPTPEESAKPVEVAWVTVAAYFDKKAQYNEMIKAGYAPYRSKAYVVGLDLQRQETLSTGELSDWQDVKPGEAMPKLELCEPQFDDETGELINKDEIRQTFELVKQAQPFLMQPPFYPVEDGDFWEVPALVGYEEEEEEEDEEKLAAGRGGEATVRVAPTAPPRGRVEGPRTGGGRVGVVRGGGEARGGRVGSGGGEAGGGRRAVAPTRSRSDDKAEPRRQIREDLAEARKLVGQKEYHQARDLANRVISNPNATAGNRSKAKRIVKAAERWLRREEARAGGVGATSGRGGAGRGDRDSVELIRHPETDKPAVWFHDDTVEAGKTYRYHTRVKLWNRYVGRKRPLKNPEDAKRSVIVGEWSLPSEPVTVTPSTYFFLTGSRPPQSAGIDVFKWRQGLWLNERFDVAIGDVIGETRKVKTGEWDEEGDEVRADVPFSTGAVVLDLRFDEPVAERWRSKGGVFSYRDRTSTVMVYLDPADGQVKERVLIFDRRDPKYRELKEEEW